MSCGTSCHIRNCGCGCDFLNFAFEYFFFKKKKIVAAAMTGCGMAYHIRSCGCEVAAATLRLRHPKFRFSIFFFRKIFIVAAANRNKLP